MNVGADVEARVVSNVVMAGRIVELIAVELVATSVFKANLSSDCSFPYVLTLSAFKNLLMA